MSSINFNEILDALFSQVSITKESFDIIFNNDDAIKYFFISIVREFTPEECLKIFNNKTGDNSNWSLIFSENVETITGFYPNIDFNFQYRYQQVITAPQYNKGMSKEIYQIAKFIIEHKSSTIKLEIISCITTLLFYPDNSGIDASLTLIEALVNQWFKPNQYNWNHFFSYDFISNILTKNDSTSVQCICVLYYIYLTKFQFYNMKTTFSEGNIAVKNKILESEYFPAVYQEVFYSHFSYLDLYKEYVENNKVANFKISSMLVILGNNIKQFFIGYDYNDWDNSLDVSNCDNYTLPQIIKEKAIDKWRRVFYRNPYKTVLSTWEYYNGNPNYYYDLEKVYTKFVENNLSEDWFTISIFIKCVIIIYIIFNNDMTNYSFLLTGKGHWGNVNTNIITFNTNLILLIYKLPTLSEEIKEEKLTWLNNIILYHDECLIHLINNDDIFNEKWVQYLIDNVESSHVSSKYFDNFFVDSKSITRIWNGFLLLGYWANKYPVSLIHSKVKDVLFIFTKVIDIRYVFTTKKNISKLWKGLFLLFKAFPKWCTEIVEFVNWIKKSAKDWVNDYVWRNYTNEQIDKWMKFVKVEIIDKKEYFNENTWMIGFKTSV